jgi:hypothetical protein
MSCMKWSLSACTLVLATLVAACGGGSSSTSTSGGSGNTTLPNVPSFDAGVGTVPDFPLVVSDSGTVEGGPGAGGDSAGEGSAGDGERIRILINFSQLSGTWTIVTSAYGVVGQTGKFTLTKDSNAGGYRFIGATLSQDNLYVSKSGLISGSLPLRLKGVETRSKFVAILESQKEASLAGIAGLYNMGYTLVSPNNPAAFRAVPATMKISATGAVRICPFAAYSDTCGDVNGATMLVGALSTIASEPGKFSVTLNGSAEGVAIAANHRYGRTILWDFVVRSAAGAVTATGTRVGAFQTPKAPDSSIYAGNWAGTATLSSGQGQSSSGNSALFGGSGAVAGALLATNTGTGLGYKFDQSAPSAQTSGFLPTCGSIDLATIPQMPGSFGRLETREPGLNRTTTFRGLTFVFAQGITSDVYIPLAPDTIYRFYSGADATYQAFEGPALFESGSVSKTYSYSIIRRANLSATVPAPCAGAN